MSQDRPPSDGSAACVLCGAECDAMGDYCHGCQSHICPAHDLSVMGHGHAPQDHVGLKPEIELLREERDRLLRVVEDMSAALHRYGMHDEDCALERPGNSPETACTCGLHAAQERDAAVNAHLPAHSESPSDGGEA